MTVLTNDGLVYLLPFGGIACDWLVSFQHGNSYPMTARHHMCRPLTWSLSGGKASQCDVTATPSFVATIAGRCFWKVLLVDAAGVDWRRNQRFGCIQPVMGGSTGCCVGIGGTFHHRDFHITRKQQNKRKAGIRQNATSLPVIGGPGPSRSGSNQGGATRSHVTAGIHGSGEGKASSLKGKAEEAAAAAVQGDQEKRLQDAR